MCDITHSSSTSRAATGKWSMDRQAELDIIRKAYAQQILRRRVVDNDRLRCRLRRDPARGLSGPAAVADHPRLRSGDYVPTPDADPVYLYTDCAGRHRARAASQQRPAFAACASHPPGRAGRGRSHRAYRHRRRLLHRDPRPSRRTVRPGDRDRIRRRPRGARDAPILRRARTSRCSRAMARRSPSTRPTSSTSMPAARGPADSWLDRLADGGRLILPMTSDEGFRRRLAPADARAGAVFRITRRGDDYFASRISAVAIFPCAGNRDEVSEQALAEAFAKGRLAAGDAPLSAPGYPRRALLGARRRLVARLQLKAEPLPVSASRQGARRMAMMWPTSRSAPGRTRPDG